MNIAIMKELSAPPVCESEILRYAGCLQADEAVTLLMREALAEILPKLSYRACYCESAFESDGDLCCLESFQVRSQGLAKNLCGVSKVLIFGATVGVEIDRAISKYGHLSPSRAVMLQAIGAERIEALCNTFCSEYATEQGVVLRPRFSPGYGDLSLETQRDIFKILDCPKNIGLCLTDSLLMSPSKSVSAIVGIEEKK